MITDAERHYDPRKWAVLTEDDAVLTLDFHALPPMDNWKFCNTTSQAFKDLVQMGRGDQAVLLDYELINLGHEPTCGSFIRRNPQGVLMLTVFTADGPIDYVEVTQ